MKLDDVLRVVHSREQSTEQLLMEIRTRAGIRTWTSLFRILSPILGINGATLHRYISKNPKVKCEASRRSRHAMMLVLALMREDVPDTIIAADNKRIRRR